jgi:hypothetical protein
MWLERRNDPETAEATMEDLAFPSPHSRAAGSEEAGRRSCLSFPANVRKIKAGKRVLSRREGGLGNGVKNPDRELGRHRVVLPFNPREKEKNRKPLTSAVFSLSL